MVHLGNADDRAMADPDALGLRRHGRENDLRRRRMRVLLEEMVLDAPHRVEAQLVGQTGLLERIVEDRALHLAS